MSGRPPRRRDKTILFVLLFIAAGAVSLSAQGFRAFMGAIDWSVRGSVLFFPEDNGNESGPMPILPTLGGSASYALNNLLAVEASLDIYGTYYDYSNKLERAVPIEIENRSTFVIGTIWGFQPVFRFHPWGEKTTLRAFGGLAFDFRICLVAGGLEGHDKDDAKEKTDRVFSYFWGGGRWLFPFAGGGMDFKVLDGLTIGFDLRVWFPVWRVWTGENAPFIEGFRFGLGFRATFG